VSTRPARPFLPPLQSYGGGWLHARSNYFRASRIARLQTPLSKRICPREGKWKLQVPFVRNYTFRISRLEKQMEPAVAISPFAP
jgi:hypothetical protein